MNQAFKECLKHNKIIPLYSTINAYYAVFHAARALLYSRGYRERSHYCLLIALETLFVETGLMGNRFIRIFRDNMSLRESADYSGSFTKDSALLSVSNAEEFIEMATSLLS